MVATKKTTPPIPDDRPRTRFDTLLTSTPVILTVIATLLAGLSTSEMTQAQYHRALAAQNQSKAGDQWNFFQAKRIRGTNMDTTADLIATLAEPGTVERARLDEFRSELVASLKQAKEESTRLVAMTNNARASLGSSSDAVARAAARLQTSAASALARAEANQKSLGSLLGTAPAVAAFDSVVKNALPSVADTPVEDPAIREVLDAMKDPKTERQKDVGLMRGVREETLRETIEAAEENARRFDRTCDPITDVLKHAAAGIAEQVRLTRSFQRSTAQFDEALNDAGAAEKKDLDGLRRTAAGLTRSAAHLKVQAGQLYADFVAARHHYNAVRYEREARYNIAIAGLYEVQVRKSSWNSERHRRRSSYFFFGMLAAQAGVTIATLSLAVKLRSVLWGLASLAGLAAILIAIGVYVYV
jgi:hypothetical protein